VESDRTGHRHIYRYQADYKLLGPVTKGEWDVRELHGVNEKSGEVYFTANERNPIGNDLYAAALDGKSMRRLTQEKVRIRFAGAAISAITSISGAVCSIRLSKVFSVRTETTETD
jgi:dipeptidyl-peptidase-4